MYIYIYIIHLYTQSLSLSLSLSLQAPLPMAADGRNVSEDAFYEYRGMPAIVHGRAQITLSLSASAQLPAKSELAAAIGPPFQALYIYIYI